MVKVYPALDLQGAWARKLLTIHLPELHEPLISRISKCQFFFHWNNPMTFLYQVSAKDLTCCGLLFRSEGTIPGKLGPPVVSYKGLLWVWWDVWSGGICVCLYSQDWWGTWNIPSKMTHFSDIKAKNCRDLGGLYSRKLTAGYPKWWALEKVTPFKHGNFWYLC